MRSVLEAVAVSVLLLAGCGPKAVLRVTESSDWKSFVTDREGKPPSPELGELRFRPGLCDGEDTLPERRQLDEGNLIAYLQRQGVDVRVERQRADLVYLSLAGVGTKSPVRLRVAILESREAAGRELHEGILQHGQGSWGVHRANLAVLGPVGTLEDDIRFAAKLKLPCWGVFTVAGLDDTFVIPGAYLEL